MKNLEKISEKITAWIGTPVSIVIHTAIFAGVFTLKFFGLTTDDILLILTTAVSLEAIYLSIFIQMSVNRTTKSIEGVEKDIDTIQEDVEDLESDVKEISEDYIEDEQEEDELINAVKEIEERIIKLHTEIDKLSKKNHRQK